jgi:sulfur-oxidizing protein SoxZ
MWWLIETWYRELDHGKYDKSKDKTERRCSTGQKPDAASDGDGFPQESGQRRNYSHTSHHELVFTNNGKQVMVANFSTAVSKNPYFSFSFKGAKAGDTLNVSWVDNLGERDELETQLK